MKHVKLFEQFLNEEKPFDKLNRIADEEYAGFGFATLDTGDMEDLIDMKKANKIAKKVYGEFGFTSLDEDDMEDLINKNPKLVKEQFLNEAKLFKTLEKTGKLIEPTGGASMNGKYYQLEGGSKFDIIHFDYDAKSKKPFGVVQVAGHHMPSKLLKQLGFRETRSWTAGVEVYIFDGNYNPKYLTEAEMAELVNEWGKGFGSYAKTFAKFYQDRGRTSGTID